MKVKTNIWFNNSCPVVKFYPCLNSDLWLPNTTLYLTNNRGRRLMIAPNPNDINDYDERLMTALNPYNQFTKRNFPLKILLYLPIQEKNSSGRDFKPTPSNLNAPQGNK